MKKKLILILTNLVLTIGAISLVLINGKYETDYVKAKEEPYKIVMNSSKNKLHSNADSTAYSGEATVQTNLGNNIDFSYNIVLGQPSSWHIIKYGGGFNNETPINGLERITLSFNTEGKEFRLFWSDSTSFAYVFSRAFTTSNSSSVTFDFNGDLPTFFRFYNGSGSDIDISEIALSYSCQSVSPSTIQWKKDHGIIPVYSSATKTVTYGLYPQKVLANNYNNSSLLSALNSLTTPESNGWYLYENDYYAKVSATPYKSYMFGSVGTKIVEGTTYWFKCEPITWNVLSESNNEYYLVSSQLLDAHCYHSSTLERTIDNQTVYSSNYKYSDIRSWLNNEFYNSAFSLGDNYIKTTTVDNSASVANTQDIYACENTADKVFLPSYQDYVSNETYGFASNYVLDYNRYCETTDWAKARGSYYIGTSDSSIYHNGYYWMRSPWYYQSTKSWMVTSRGDVDESTVTSASAGVRPAIIIPFWWK